MNSKQGSQVRQQVNTSVLGCPFMTETKAEDQSLELLAYTVPVCAILVCNTVFLVWIMGVRVVSSCEVRSLPGLLQMDFCSILWPQLTLLSNLFIQYLRSSEKDLAFNSTELCNSDG